MINYIFHNVQIYIPPQLPKLCSLAEKSKKLLFFDYIHANVFNVAFTLTKTGKNSFELFCNTG